MAMLQSWFNYPYMVVVIAAIAVSVDAVIVAFLLGRFVDRITPANIIQVPGRFAISHSFLTFFGWLMAAPMKGWVSYSSLWILVGSFLIIGWRALSHYSPLVEKSQKRPLKPSAARLDLMASAASIDGLLVGILAVSVNVSALIACLIVGGVVLVLTSIAYTSERFFCDRKIGGRKIKSDYNIADSR